MITVSRVSSSDFYTLTTEGVQLERENPFHEHVENIFLIKQATSPFLAELGAFVREANVACWSMKGRAGLFVFIPDQTAATMFWLRFGGRD